jgi:glycerol-3-phosphate cytidylyltransferase-like family protein
MKLIFLKNINTCYIDTHYLYHSWDLLNSCHIKFLEKYRLLNPNIKIIACISNFNDKYIYNIYERAIIIYSIKEIDDIIIENEYSDKTKWININIDFNKFEYIQLLVNKIINNIYLKNKLLKYRNNLLLNIS